MDMRLKTMKRLFVAALVLPILSACGGGDGAGDWAGIVVDSAGIPLQSVR